MGDIFQQRDASVATITLSNPGKLNALDAAMWCKLALTFDTLSQDESLRCIILQGADGNFAAGADIAEFSSLRANAAQGIDYHANLVSAALDAITNCLHPTVAAIEGACVGGGLEIACACDMRIAAPLSRFGVPIKHLGFALAPAEMQGMIQLIGLAATLEILLEGRIFDAAEARQKGLVHRIVKDVTTEAKASARRIADGAPLAARMNKKLARRLSPLPQTLTPEEFSEAYALLDSRDYHEAVAAFLANRKPVFTGT